MVQRCKLHDRDPGQTRLMDKIAAKQIASALLGPEWTTPTLWHGTALPSSPPFPMPAILKARHGCNQYQVLRSDPSPREWAALRNRSSRWMAGPYGQCCATHVQVHLDRAGDHRWILHDRGFRPLVTTSERLLAPRSLNAMLRAAETLAAGHDFLRVDFFEIDGAPRFGEFCLYPGSGLDRFAHNHIDLELGELWHAARGEAAAKTRAPAACHSAMTPST